MDLTKIQVEISESLTPGTIALLSPVRYSLGRLTPAGIEIHIEPFEGWVKRCAVITNVETSKP